VTLRCDAVTRVFSGIQPTGALHLGNMLGAVQFWVRSQDTEDAIFCVVDLHGLTLQHDPAEFRAATLNKGAELLACGLDPARCILFVQSHVPAHTEMCWLMECTAAYGELRRMTQFKEKSATGQDSSRAGLLTYPCLMAADILLYNTDRVPVGDDQRQHLELARDLAIRWNHRYGDTFVVPEASIPEAGARVMDLQEPTSKMSKSRGTPQGRIDLLDSPTDITRKVKRAVTDTDGEVRYDRAAKPGVSNLLELLAAVTGTTPQAVAERYSQYGPLKADTAEAVVEYLRPFQERFAEVVADPGYVPSVLAEGAGKASSIARPVLARARAAIGLLEPALG
jgi:tryptophanyl-tRNA synthetase